MLENEVSSTALEALKCKEGNCMPFLALLYKHRSLCMHAVVDQSLTSLFCEDAKAERQLLVLGCGLDTSYEEIFAERRGVSVFHVDLPEVVSLGGYEHPVPADLRDVGSLHEKLIKAGFSFSTRTVVLSEMVLNYLPKSAVQSLLSFLSSTFCDEALFVSYDFVLPLTSLNLSLFATSMLDNFKKRGAPLLCVQEGRAAQRRMFRRNGWRSCRAISIQKAITMDTIVSAPRSADQRKEGDFVFDEFSSLARADQLYTLTLAGLSEGRGDKDSGTASAHSIVLSRLGLGLPRPTGHDGGERGTLDTSQTVDSDIQVPGGQQSIRIRRLSAQSQRSLWENASVVYAAAMEPYARQYPPVRKFVKAAMRQFTKPYHAFQPPSPALDNSLFFWVATALSGSGCDLVVGCIALIPRRADRAEVSHMSVCEEYRGLGVGAALLRACLTTVAQHKYTPFLSVLRDLAAARRLYARHGFREDSDPKDLGSGCILHSMVIT